MKKMIVILIAGVVVGITISGLYKHFVTDRIMDGGDTVNPDYQLLDGDHTYVDNDVLWPVLEGTWESEDARWQARIDKAGETIALTREGEAVLTGPLYFTYLRPGKACYTELRTESRTLCTPAGTAVGDIQALGHEPGEGEDDPGTLVLELQLPQDPAMDKMVFAQVIFYKVQ